MFRRLSGHYQCASCKHKEKSVKMQYCIQQQTTYVYENIEMWKFKNTKG